MRVFLNEQSIPEKTKDCNEIYIVLDELIRIATTAKKISNNKPILRHRDLKNKEVLPGIRLIDFIVSLGDDKVPSRRNVKALFLELFAKAPFLTGPHNPPETITNLDGDCLRSSCFDDASACRSGAAVISVAAGNHSTNKQIYTRSSILGDRCILNISTLSQLEELLWVYESNKKHEISKDFCVDGEIHSAMTLTDSEAQYILTNGVKIGKSVYNKIGTQWYKFHCHEGNKFHGFPINVRTQYREFSSASILFDEIKINEDGQLLEELMDVRRKNKDQ